MYRAPINLRALMNAAQFLLPEKDPADGPLMERHFAHISSLSYIVIQYIDSSSVHTTFRDPPLPLPVKWSAVDS